MAAGTTRDRGRQRSADRTAREALTRPERTSAKAEAREHQPHDSLTAPATDHTELGDLPAVLQDVTAHLMAAEAA